MRNQYLSDDIYESLPEILKRITEPFQNREKDIVLLSTLSVLSSALPKVYGNYRGKKNYANLYLLIVAPPASGKGVMNFSRLLLKDIDHKVYNDNKAKNLSISNQEEKLPDVVKIIPANTSSAELYSLLANVHESGIMIESEADTLSVMFKNDWSNFSDVLRKTFHHETVTMSRKTEDLVRIEEPKLSLVMSGTPDQLQPLIQSKENGLFSRFAYYSFSETQPWGDVFEVTENLDEVFLKTGKEAIYRIYGDLYTRETELEFQFTEIQKQRFNSIMSEICSIVQNHHPKIFDSNVKRHGIIFFRICMILTALRNHNNLNKMERLICCDEDFQTAYKIVRILLYHALEVLYLMGEKGLPALDENILSRLDSPFERKEAQRIGMNFNVPIRTLDYKLKQWLRKNIIRKVSHGKYEKLRM